jgi:hypothetical protein
VLVDRGFVLPRLSYACRRPKLFRKAEGRLCSAVGLKLTLVSERTLNHLGADVQGRPHAPSEIAKSAQTAPGQNALPGQPPRFIRCHEGDDIGDVLGLTQAPERGLGDDAGLEL